MVIIQTLTEGYTNNTNNKINKDNNSLGKNTANAKAGELQTGETNDSQKLSVIGMALMGILVCSFR